MRSTIRYTGPVGLILIFIASYALSQIEAGKDRFNILGLVEVRVGEIKPAAIPTVNREAVYEAAPAETSAGYDGWIAGQAEMKQGADWSHAWTKAEGCPVAFCVSVGNGEDPYLEAEGEANFVGKIGGGVSGGAGSYSGSAPGSDATDAEKREYEQKKAAYDQKVRDLQRELDGLNGQISTLSSEASGVEGSLNKAIGTLNIAIVEFNAAKSEEMKWWQAKSDSEEEEKRYQALKTRKEDFTKQREIDLSNVIGQVRQKTASVNEKSVGKVKPAAESNDQSKKNIENGSQNHGNQHNKSLENIHETARIDKKLVDTTLTPMDYIKGVNTAGVDMSNVKTPPNSPYYRDLAYTKSELNQARGRLTVSPLSDDQKRNLTKVLELGDLLFAVADLQFSSGDPTTGSMVLERCHGVLGQVFDTLSDVAPGISLLKDLVTLGTGVNPATFESASDVELAIISGTLLVPGAAKFVGKRVAQGAEWLSRIVSDGGHQSATAGRILDTIKRADEQLDEILDQADCLAHLKPSIWDYIALVPTAYACPGKVGKSVDIVEKSAEAAGVTKPQSVAKYTELARKHEIDLKTLTPEQNKNLGDLTRGNWTNHGNKHLKASTEAEAKRLSETGERIAQYLPNIDNRSLEEKALIYGVVVPRPGGNYHAYFKFDKAIGYANGNRTEWIRAEWATDYHGHPRDVIDIPKHIKELFE